MPEAPLTAEEREAIRSYMLRLITIPGSLAAIVIFGLGFVINDVFFERAENIAYKITTETLYPQAEQVARAVSSAELSEERVETLAERYETKLHEAEELEKSLRTSQALRESDELVDNVVKSILSQTNFGAELRGEFGGRVSALEEFLKGSREGKEECSWRPVGYNKAHGHDQSEWCPTGFFISQIDVDSCSDGASCPVIGQVRCCKVFP